MEENSLQDPQIVLFQGSTPLQPGEVELHRFRERLFGRNLNDVKADWAKISVQLREMLDSFAPQVPRGFALDSVQVSLGFSAQGKLVFIAEAGVEASVTIEFRRELQES
jgi:hypothetical protein